MLQHFIIGFMSYVHLKERKFYEDIYDRSTVMTARRQLASFEEFRTEWFKMNEDKDEKSFRNVFHLNWIYMLMCGNELVDRYYARDEHIAKMMRDDEAKDDQIASARLSEEPYCHHCGKQGLRIIDKSLMHRNKSYKIDDPEEVLFMLRCPHCDKNSAFWEDGTPWKVKPNLCPKCKTEVTHKSVKTKTTIVIPPSLPRLPVGT